MSAKPQYSLYALSSAILESFKRFQDDNQGTLAALVKLARTAEIPDCTAYLAKSLKSPRMPCFAPSPQPSYFEWKWDEEAENQDDQACLDNL